MNKTIFTIIEVLIAVIAMAIIFIYIFNFMAGPTPNLCPNNDCELEEELGGIGGTGNGGGGGNGGGNGGPDTDGDGTPDADDNCVDISNPSQGDADNDDTGDSCDDEIVIFSCGNLTPANTEPDVTGWAPNETYLLGNDLSNTSGSCLNPAFIGPSSIIDCLDHFISAQTGLQINSPTTIQNCRINITGTTTSNYGIRINAASTIQNNIISGPGSGLSKGIYFTSGSQLSNIINNTISDFHYGLYTDQISSVSDLTVNSNTICGYNGNPTDIFLQTSDSSHLGSTNNTCKRNQCFVNNLSNALSNICVQKDADGMFNDCQTDC